jgi:hypothetical protein
MNRGKKAQVFENIFSKSKIFNLLLFIYDPEIHLISGKLVKENFNLKKKSSYLGLRQNKRISLQH